MKLKLDDFAYDYGKIVSYPTAEENRRSFVLDNRSRSIVKKWAIDKNVFKNNISDKKCDYLLEVQKDNIIYFWVELKGKDLTQACRQILRTIELIDISDKAIQHARIITSGTNKIDVRSSEYQKLDKTMRKTGGCLTPYTNKGTEII